jgi:hypothetical protein
MGLVYLYLTAWIAGGVLLGTTMLLRDGHEQALDEGMVSHAAPPRPATQVLSLGLIGFGLGGMAAAGLGLVSSEWTAGCALLGAGLVGLAGYFARDRG